MTQELTPPPDTERYLSPAAVAGRFLTRVESVLEWVEEGRIRAERDARGRLRIPESAVLDFQRQAYRRENFPGLSHGLHSWPVRVPEGGNLPVVVDDAQQGEEHAARWPFPHA